MGTKRPAATQYGSSILRRGGCGALYDDYADDDNYYYFYYAAPALHWPTLQSQDSAVTDFCHYSALLLSFHIVSLLAAEAVVRGVSQ